MRARTAETEKGAHRDSSDAAVDPVIFLQVDIERQQSLRNMALIVERKKGPTDLTDVGGEAASDDERWADGGWCVR